MGACHIDRQTLINAQKHLDEYRDLIVRVAGYSDHFRNLDKALQDEIIERTEQSFLLKNVREGSRQAAFSVIITKYEEVILMKKEYLYAGTSVLCFGTARLKAQTAFVINELWPALIILLSCWILKEKMNLGKAAAVIFSFFWNSGRYNRRKSGGIFAGRFQRCFLCTDGGSVLWHVLYFK